MSKILLDINKDVYKLILRIAFLSTEYAEYETLFTDVSQSIHNIDVVLITELQRYYII